MGKFWFFIVSLLIILMFVFYRGTFGKQLSNRLKGFLSRYYFNELVSDKGTVLRNGSIWATVIILMVFAQFAVVGVSYLKYQRLANNLLFLIVILLAYGLWRVILAGFQYLQIMVLDGQELLRNNWQRLISLDLIISFILFPLINLAYYNSSRLASLDMGAFFVFIFLFWLLLRTAWGFVGWIQDGGLKLKYILYFCTFEILPHGILISALYRAYQ